MLSALIRSSSAETGGASMVRPAWSLLVVGLLLCTGALSACGSAASGGTITLTVSTNQVGDQAKVLQDIATKFTQQNPNIKVDFSAPGAEYENIMKVKMASGKLPDVF